MISILFKFSKKKDGNPLKPDGFLHFLFLFKEKRIPNLKFLDFGFWFLFELFFFLLHLIHFIFFFFFEKKGAQKCEKLEATLFRNFSKRMILWKHLNWVFFLQFFCFYISQILYLNCDICVIDSNKIGDEGCKLICQSLLENTTLEKLDLSWFFFFGFWHSWL